MAARGVLSSFSLGSAASPGDVTDISGYLNKITSTSSNPSLDGTVFQPGVSVPLKINVPSFSEKGYDLEGIWSAAAETFFSALEGAQGVDYEYGPDGTGSGKAKISGTCNVGSYSGPITGVNELVTFTVHLDVTARTSAQYS